MKTVAIVCEYNPFHNGHKYQIDSIKRDFGEDTAIIAIMSGNFVERGDVAILDKFKRARIAVENGVSLVLELPFPFSLAGAEGFAQAAVSIAEGLGTVDALSFGSECGSLEDLTRACDRVLSEDFDCALKALLATDGNEALGYAKARTLAYETLYGKDEAEILLSPNNILAIEYLKALKKLGSSILPHTILRNGTDKDSTDTATHAGATYIRSLFYKGKTEEALLHIPKTAQNTVLEAIKDREMPASIHALSSAVLTSVRVPRGEREIAECAGGLYEYLSKKALEASTLNELFKIASTKKYTDARIRRATLFSFFGVTSAEVRESVLYTQVLAMDGIGQAVLHHIRKTAEIAVITKPADLRKLSPDAKAQAERAYRADSVYALTLPMPRAADFFLRISPFRK